MQVTARTVMKVPPQGWKKSIVCSSLGQWIFLLTHTHADTRAHPSHHSESLFLAHMLPFCFHIDCGSKSAQWGLKHWPWRGPRATRTDGNPLANPSSSQPIITSLWPRALLPKPPLPLSSSLLVHSVREKDDAFLNLITISKIPYKISPHGPILGWWQGAMGPLILNISES